jgi:hypothetical protein
MTTLVIERCKLGPTQTKSSRAGYRQAPPPQAKPKRRRSRLVGLTPRGLMLINLSRYQLEMPSRSG